MNVVIEIHFISGSRGLQKGSFKQRGRKPENIALDFWKEIKKEMSHRAKLEKVIVDGDQDITHLVIDLEKEEWHKSMEDNLPF
jgi:exonuclease III